MKKNIILIIGMAASNFLFLNASINEFELGSAAQENYTIKSCDGSEEFEDFFGNEEEEDVAKPRQKKQKPTALQLAMIRLGVAVVLRVESYYSCLLSFFAYLKSWVIHEKRKA